MTKLKVYEVTFCFRVEYQAHSLSNEGSNGSILTVGRQQKLADGSVVDALSGNQAKHHHAELLTEKLAELGVPLCPACKGRDGRRAAALAQMPEYKDIIIDQILSGCGMCDIHGFLIPEKRIDRTSTVQFGLGLAIPDRHTQTIHLYTRSAEKAEDQKWFKKPARSGWYAFCWRYRSKEVGVETKRWRLIVDNEEERLKRHRAILYTWLNQLISPLGAMTSTMLPHLTGMEGAIMVQTKADPAPVYSALQDDFIEKLKLLGNDSAQVYPFYTIDQFAQKMTWLAENSSPSLPAAVNIK